jgi:glycosyltransferase involved in cell wall biosynthesis
LKLSIITINLNNADGLKTTIESVVKQTYKEIEYIIVDGASTDGSIEVIKKFGEKIAYWVSEGDNGVYEAMNKGIKKASGEYCVFLNSGDYLVNNSVVELLLQDTNHESIIYSNLLKVFPNGKKLVDTNNTGKPFTMLNFFSGTINHSGTLIKRELFEKYGLYDETLKIVSDWKFFLEVVSVHNESVCYKNIVSTVFNMDGISNTHRQLEKAEREKVLKEILPVSIYLDYEKHSTEIKKLQRINRYPWAKFIQIREIKSQTKT